MSPAPVIPDGSTQLRFSFVALTAAIALEFVAAVYWSARNTGAEQGAATRRTIVAAAFTALWIGVTGIAASRGVLHFSAPPTMMVVIVATLALAIGLALSPVGARLIAGLPIALLVGFQGFRVIVELLLHRAYVEGLMPVQMSYAGRNFDVVSGITALALGAWLATGRRSRMLIGLWNTLGLALLLNVLVVAMLSAPTPFRVFMNEPSNVWITRAPWVWLPAVMVFAAILGHALVFRWLVRDAGASRLARSADSAPEPLAVDLTRSRGGGSAAR
jgi:hypothetical protein